MDYKEKKIDQLLISESNYSCQFFDESFIKMKNEKQKKIYQLEEKEKDIYEQQEELGKKMVELIFNNQKKFKYKYNLLQKEEDLNHKEYKNFNGKIIKILNQNKNNQNGYCIDNDNNPNIMNYNSFFEVFDNKWVFLKKEYLNTNSFKLKCNIKSCEKKIIKAQNNKNASINNIRNKNKAYRKSAKSTNNIKNSLKKNNSNNKIVSKREKNSNIKYGINKSNKKNKIRTKSRATISTTTQNSNASLFEDNKLIYDKNLDLNYFINNNENSKENELIIKPDYSKYLTRENFYPRSLRIKPHNKERLTNEQLFYETKTSFRNNRIMKDLYNQAFKKCNYHSNSYYFYDK